MAARAKVTKGAVYHHFDGKRQLFEAVCVGDVAKLTETLGAVYALDADPWNALHAGCRAFLTACLEPGLQRILLLDAIGAIGWQTMRDLEAPLLDHMDMAITRAMDAGRLAPRPARPLAHFLFGALCEMAMVVARAENQRAAYREAVAELGRIMAALAD